MNKDCFFNDEISNKNEFCRFYKKAPMCEKCPAYVNKEKADKVIFGIANGSLFDKEEDDLK